MEGSKWRRRTVKASKQAQVMVAKALNEISRATKERDKSLEDLIERGGELRYKLIEQK